MNWSEEKYVKLFVRDTPTWLSWPWEARALAPLLMRALEGEGRLAIGRLEPARAVALTVHLPIEVVAVGLPAMLEDGTLELREDGLWWPKYEEAQESRKSEALRSREHRARQRRDSSTPTRHAASHGVTQRHTPSPSSPAQPSTAQPERTAPRAPKTPKPEKPPDPRHAPLVRELTETFQRETGAKYPFGPIDAAAVTALLAKGIEPTIVAAWAKALRSTAYPVVRTLPELVKHLAHFVGKGARAGPDPNIGILERPESACDVCDEGSVGVYASISVCSRHYALAQAEAKRLQPATPWTCDLRAWAASQRQQGAAA